MDDLGTTYDGPRPARRVVSLVPSLTEALVSVDRGAVVGATEWCTHPGDLDVTRVRGTKNPDLAAVRALEPDVVVVNKEENRELDVRRLRAAGVRVWVTDIETVPGSVTSMERLLDGIGWQRPAWLARARELWCGPLPPVTRRVVVPIWRDPWMVVGPATFTSDLCRRLGWETLPAQGDSRYPAMTVEEIDALGADAVLLPDEPYEFTADDGPEALRSPSELVDGRMLTWYGPSLVDAHASVERRDA
ncbi:Vitamin B12-binding protein [Nocardioides dokdonensis FR1436]|uniref:Vitamin B12-binding protein n=1 Tax=Nocardioides dokdonensis FR1436 TaxID=1300347 RepID=A0A1A9GIH6_9ACTN|nr:helical backbone metal receptor [Nocardioides dokdonensis]ANH38078.1 Vitamin B12-binding protein [Nocardioides dokdonensis FR1436]